MKVEVIDSIETRTVKAEKSASGELSNSYPVSGSERYFLKLKLPNNNVLTAEISYSDFNKYMLFKTNIEK